jgi:hypothetical protein
MHLLSPEQILARSADPSACTARVALQPIDFSRPFIPERFTQLYYAPAYGRLERRHRLRYNQLFAVRVSEQFMAFEQDFTNRVVARLARDPRVDPALSACLARMVREEEAHQAMFHELNGRCLPELYGGGARFFTRLGRLESWAFTLATTFARRLPFLLFFIVALEEYSSALSRAMMKERETELGPLEENFVRVHTEHVKDEARHVHLDVHLIQAIYAGASRLGRRLNARLLASFLRDIVVPKRSGLAVLRRLIAEHPELKAVEAELTGGLRALAHDQAFQKSLFNRELMPHTFALFDGQPELAILTSVLKGYERA